MIEILYIILGLGIAFYIYKNEKENSKYHKIVYIILSLICSIVFLVFYELFLNKKRITTFSNQIKIFIFVLVTIITAAIIMPHNIIETSLSFIGCAIAYYIYKNEENSTQTKKIIYVILSLFLSIIFLAFYELFLNKKRIINFNKSIKIALFIGTTLFVIIILQFETGISGGNKCPLEGSWYYETYSSGNIVGSFTTYGTYKFTKDCKFYKLDDGGWSSSFGTPNVNYGYDSQGNWVKTTTHGVSGEVSSTEEGTYKITSDGKLYFYQTKPTNEEWDLEIIDWENLNTFIRKINNDRSFYTPNRSWEQKN